MDRTRLISIRIYEDALKEIDQFCEKTIYWKRNRVLNAILTSLFLNARHEDIKRLTTWWIHSSTKLKISVNESEM